MKAFEEWILEDECPVLSTYDEKQREKGWRAALEEVLSQLKRPIYSADIMKWIEEELKGGD